MTAAVNREKIAIVGAGITGLYLAWRLQEKGFRVTVFEKRDRVGAKPCSSLISERIKSFVPIPERLCQREIDSIVVHFPKKDIRMRPKPSFLLFERKELDEFLFNLAQKAGAQIVFEKEVNEIPEGFLKIIGCDGALSGIRKLLSLRVSSFRLGIQYFVKDNNSLSDIEIWPKVFDSFPKYGFFWKIPKIGKIEYGALGPKSCLKKEFDNFCKKQNVDIDPKEIKAALIPQGICLPAEGNITLCGDAAGLAKPTTGGGVIWGLTAADILINNFSDFNRYKKEAERFFKPKILKGKAVVSLGCFLGKHIPYILPNDISIDADLF